MTVYSDLDVELGMHPVTHDVLKKTDAHDVRQSLKLLIKTQFYSRLWNPKMGSRLQSLLFGQNDSYQRHLFKTELERLINTYEPRVKINHIEVEQSENVGQVNVKLDYTILRLNMDDTYIFQLTKLR